MTRLMPPSFFSFYHHLSPQVSKMLRLNPTQLRLDARDLSWHIDRHNERQILRAKQSDARTQVSSYSFPQPSAAGTAEVIDKHDDSIISSEPVPHDSRSFWDRVLADAGTPTRTQTTSSGNVTVIEPSDEFLENHHSSRASIEDDDINWHDENDDRPPHSDDLPSPFLDPDADVDSQRLLRSSSASPDSTGSDPSNDANKTDKNQKLSPGKMTETASAMRRLSFNNFNFFRRKVTPDLDGSLETSNHPPFANKDYDGRYKSRWSHERSGSGSSNSSAGGDLRDGMYGSRQDRRTISASLEACVNGRSNAEGSSTSHLSVGASSQSMLPIRSMPQHSEDIQRHASGLPRSSLYISQAATSSSPHKVPDTATDHHGTPTYEGYPALPSRRRRRYKPRSESYPFVSSEDLDMSALPQMDGPSTLQTADADLPSLTVSYPSTHNMIPTPPLGIPAWTYPHFGASPASNPIHEDHHNGEPHAQAQAEYEWSSPHESQQESIEIHSYRSRSSMSSHSQIGSIHPSPSRRNLSPFAEPFVPRSTRRHASPQLPLPPPFSATPRNLSLNSAIPSSSLSPNTPPSRLPSYSISPTIIPYQQTHIPIYNDNLPSHTQPQTPAELSRNNGRRPPMATRNPFNTAPARPQGASARGDRLTDWQAFATPTRRPSARSRHFGDYEQENTGAVDVEERLLRRQLAEGVRMGREEMERRG